MKSIALFLLAGFLVSWCAAQTSAPATAPAPRQVSVPPGFVAVQVEGKRVLCGKDEESLVRASLAGIEPATRPSTMPSDISARLAAQREALVVRIAGDLALSDPAPVRQFVDEQMVPMLQKIEQTRVPLVYIATDTERLKQIMREGWSDPRFQYNRVADEVSMSTDVALSDAGQMDEVLIPVVYPPDASAEDRTVRLRETVRAAEANVAESYAARAQFLVHVGLAQFITETLVKGRELKDDQVWLAVGAAGVLSSRYMQELTGADAEGLIARLTFEHPRNPVKAASVDLLHPTDLSAIREQYVPLHLEAARRKAMLVVNGWMQQAGAEALPKTLRAIDEQKPADGAALLALIREVTGVDLSGKTSKQ